MNDVLVFRTRGEDYYAFTRGEFAGCIMRINTIHAIRPTRSWRAVRIVQPWGFGRKTAIVFDTLANWKLDPHCSIDRGDFWTYKNGRGKFRLMDYDHGTIRQWGEPLQKVSGWSYTQFASYCESLANQAAFKSFNGQPRPDQYRSLASLAREQLGFV